MNLKRETYFALRRLRDSDETPYTTLDEVVADIAWNATEFYTVLYDPVRDSLKVETEDADSS